ncbi:MAG: hypothetical protein JRH10_16575 [Deltaproteobacteria bacterium]|nr:hypothetical protein [Deltaproteobacteria bacterium]
MNDSTGTAEAPLAPTERAASPKSPEARPPRTLLGATAFGLGIFALLLAANSLNEWLFGPFVLHTTPLAGADAPGSVNHERVHGVLVALTAFLMATHRYERRRLSADLLRLEPLTTAMPGGFRAFVLRQTAMPRRALWVSAVGGAVIGIASYLGSTTDPVNALRNDQPAHLMWALGSNTLLVAAMIYSGQRTWMAHRAIARIVSCIESIPLLDRAALAPFAHVGIRHAFYWAAASSIVSLLALDFVRLAPLLVSVAVTLAVATAALFGPALTVHRRIRAAKEAELVRLRERIASACDVALASDGANAEAGAAVLPGLLAWEARVSAVREWPFDPSTWLRFGALVVLSIGSWLGGAVVERALGAVLD